MFYIDRSLQASSLPIPHGSVELPIHGQICALVWELLRKLLVVIHSQAGLVTRMQETLFEIVLVRKNVIRLFGVPHVFLDSEIGNGNIEMQRSSHGHRR